MATMNQQPQLGSLLAAPAILPLLSHELRTPLAAIKGFAALLVRYQDRLPPGEQQEMLDEIAVACERLERVIAQVMQICEIAAEQVDFAPMTFDLAQLLRTTIAVREQRERSPTDHAAYSLAIKPPGLCWVYGDPRHVEYLLGELLELAHTFSTIEPILVMLRDWPDAAPTSSISANKSWWNVEIRIVGSHLNPDHLAKLFQPFTASTHLLVDDVSHIALTLAYCRLMAGLHGGLFWFESHADNESALHLVLPAVA